MKQALRRRLVLLWLLLPVGLLAYHYGPGVRQAQCETAARVVQQARAAARAHQWAAAVALYARALQALPPDAGDDRVLLGVAQADAQMHLGALPEAVAALEDLLLTVPVMRPAVATHLRSALAEAQYYTAWLMRLEGADDEEWYAEATAARQQFRLLAEQQPASISAATSVYHTNLEASIRLALMDEAALKALPLPAKLCACKNVSQKMRKQRASQRQQQKAKSEGKKEKKDARGAGLGERPEETGS